MGILSGIRVLDFGRYIAGPWCAALLADHGADVIRVERIGGGEDRDMLPVGSEEAGALFLQMNRNKRSLTLDPQNEDGRAVLARLAGTADVVVANLPDKALQSFGLDYESLKSLKSDIILASTTAFGTTGPYGDKVGFDVTAQAMSGAMHLTGHADEPMRSYVSWVDYQTGALLAFATLLAIMHRDRTGRGQRVEGTLLATALTTANSHLIEQALTNKNRVGSGNRSQVSAPADVFRTRDGDIVVQVVGNPMFKRWAELMGEDSWLKNPKYKNDEARGENGTEISARMQTWCDERTTAEALEALKAARIPAAPVYSAQQALTDPHVKELGIFYPMAYPGLPDAPIAEHPVRLSQSPGVLARRAPRIGEHTKEVLSELGFSDEDIERLRDANAV